MIDRGSLAATLGAYLTGVAVTSAPWLLTTAVLMTLRLLSAHDPGEGFAEVERIVTLVYAATVVLSAPVHVVVSRFTADRLYERKTELIAAPIWRALTFTVLGFALVGAGIMVYLRARLALAIPGTLLTVVVGAGWLMLSVGGGLSSPAMVLRAFGLGAPLSVIAAVVLARGAHLGGLGYLLGFTLGQLLTLALLVYGVARSIPAGGSEEARLLPAFSEYRLLAASAFVYHLSIWADKLIVWLWSGSAVASLYTTVAALAWFTVVPAFGWIYVQIETSFYQRFRAFYSALTAGAPLAGLRRGASQITVEAGRVLRGAALVQGAVTAIALAAAPSIASFVHLEPSAVPALRFAIVGAAFQIVTLLEILVLYYFDLRQDALTLSLSLLVAECFLTAVASLLALPPALGYAIACFFACATGLLLVRSRLQSLLVDTFQSQPFATDS